MGTPCQLEWPRVLLVPNSAGLPLVRPSVRRRYRHPRVRAIGRTLTHVYAPMRLSRPYQLSGRHRKMITYAHIFAILSSKTAKSSARAQLWSCSGTLR
jgi:hypothetical protein